MKGNIFSSELQKRVILSLITAAEKLSASVDALVLVLSFSFSRKVYEKEKKKNKFQCFRNLAMHFNKRTKA